MAVTRVINKCNIVVFVVAAVVVFAVAGAVWFFIIKKSSTADTENIVYQELDPPDVTLSPSPSSSILGNYTKAGVVSCGELCAGIGRTMLEKNGSAVDALIASMLCDGLMCPQSMGIGGGFLMTIYTKANNSVVTLNARETAPAAATQDMYNGSSTASKTGALAVGVPGELKGYYAAWKRFGNLNWSELFEPTIKLCEEGIPVNQHLVNNLQNKEEMVFGNEGLRSFLVVNNTMVKLGDNMTRPQLAKTLRAVAYGDLNVDELYNGNLTESLVKDIQNAGGIITKEDLNSYKPEWGQPITAKLSGGLTMHSMPLPGSGLLVGFMLRVLDGFLENTTNVQKTQRITEAFKHAYGRRSELGDSNYYNVSAVTQDLTSEDYIEQIRSKISDYTTSQDYSYYGAKFSQATDHGTANMVVVAPNGDAAVATSTVNLLFGSKFVSNSTGIILNDQMDDFSSSYINYFGIPPSPANFIAPGKRPLSSMCPTIFVDSNGDVQLALGSAGGTKITTSVTFVAIQNLWYNKTIKEAVDAPRFHHQLTPMKLEYEYGTLKEIAKGMAEIGHVIERVGTNATWGSCVTAVARNGPNVQANNDFRRPGGMDGY